MTAKEMFESLGFEIQDIRNEDVGFTVGHIDYFYYEKQEVHDGFNVLWLIYFFLEPLSFDATCEANGTSFVPRISSELEQAIHQQMEELRRIK